MADGVDLRGYTPWGCIDLVSASTGEIDVYKRQDMTHSIISLGKAFPLDSLQRAILTR